MIAYRGVQYEKRILVNSRNNLYSTYCGLFNCDDIGIKINKILLDI